MALWKGTLLVTVLASASFESSVHGAELQVSFRSRKPGQIVYAVFDNQDAWRTRKPARLSGALKGQSRTLRIDFPPGDYAVMAFLDGNGNGRLDTLPIGLPTEPYGFSNNARGTFGPPAWTASKFKLNAGGSTQSIDLR